MRVTKPVKALAPDKLRNAPVDETPVPKTVMASGTVTLLVNCSDAPLATVVMPAVLPRPVELDTDKMPPFTLVAPV